LQLRNKESEGLLHSLNVARAAPSISHLFFADDNMLFVRATQNEALQVLHILKQHELASG